MSSKDLSLELWVGPRSSSMVKLGKQIGKDGAMLWLNRTFAGLNMFDPIY